MATILIVEDSPTQAEILRMILDDAGYATAVATGAETAFLELTKTPCDLIISDVMMPEQSGYEFCRRLKESPDFRTIPVMFVTSLSDPMDIIMGLEAGAENFIPKPYQASYLLDRVKAVLNNNRDRETEKFAVGVEVSFLGRKFIINANRQQIIDLLIQTFEETVRANQALRISRAELAAAKALVEDRAVKLEGQVQTSEAKYQMMMENANDALFILNLDGIVQEANRAAHQLLGRLGSSLVGVDFNQCLAQARKGEFKVMSATDDAATVEFQMLKSDGTTCWAELSMSPVTVGAVPVLLVIARDISRRKGDEQQLASKQETLSAIAANMADALITTNDVGIIESANHAAEQMFGWSIAELVGQNVTVLVSESDLIDDDGGFGSDLKSKLGTFIGVGPREVMALHKEGKRIPVELTLAKMSVGGQCRFIGVVRDISKRKQAEAEQRDLQARFLQAQKMEAIGNLTGGLAHDFNNILAIVIGNLDLLSDTSVPKDPDAVQLVADATTAALRGAELTRHLLAFSRRQPLDPEVFNINDRVEGVMKLLKRLLQEDIETAFVPGTGVWDVKADPVQLESVLANLAVNARDAMPTGGRLVVETRNVHLDSDYAVANAGVIPGDYVMIEVSDTGHGIPPEILSQVIEPFFTTKAVGKGSGLGLSMVYGFIKQSGGDLKIYSEVGRGTTVRIYLPRVKTESDTVVTDDVGPDVETTTLAKTILVVDDNPDVRKMVVAQLKRFEHRIYEACDGHQALDILLRIPEIDLLFTDLVMPGGMNGLELARTARERHPGLKVLFTSGFPLSMMNEGMFGPDDVLLSKPYRTLELQRKIADAFNH